MAIVQVATSPKNVSRANRAVVRTSGGVVYVATAEGPTSPTIRMWKGNTTSGGPTSFSEADSISDSNDNAGCAIAIDSNDVIHCFYNKTEVGMQGQPVVRYVTFDTSTDTFGTAEDVANLDFDTAINFVGIAIDSNDKPHVVWKDGVTSMGNTTRHIYYSNKTGASWRSRVSVTSIVNTNAYGHGLDITIGPPGGTITADRPIIALNFFDQSTTRKLRGYYGNALDATSFTNNDDIGNGVDPNWTSVISMAFNSVDRLQVSYTENSTNDWQTANHLVSADFSTGWSTGFIDTANDYIHTSLGDWGDIYRLCVSERSGNNDLYLYEDNGISTWTQNTDGDFPIAGDYEYPKLRWARYNHFEASEMDVVFETNAGAIYYSYQAFVNNVVKILNETIDVWEIGRVPKPDVLYWQAENNANDSVGSRNGTFSAGTYATGKSGFGNCFNHAGATGADTVSIFDDNTPEMTSDSWTMNVWCNPDQYRIQGLILKDNAPGNTSFRVFMNSTSTNGVIEFDGEVSGTSEIGNITASGFKVGEWHMCTIVYDDATTTMKIYIDGKLSQSANVSATPLVNPDTAFQLAGNIGTRWDGKTDEMAWWSYALDDDQIRNLYWSQDSGVLFQPLAVKSILPAINETMNILELVDEPPLFYYKGNNNIIPETAHTITTQAGSPGYSTGKLKPTANGAIDGDGVWWGKVTPKEDFDWDMRTKACSFSFWLYIPTGATAGNHAIFGPRNFQGATDIGWDIFYRETDLDIRWEISDGVTDWQVNSSNLSKDTWYHVFITNDGSNSGSAVNMYINGVLDNSQTAGTWPVGTTASGLDVGFFADSDGSGIVNSGIRVEELIIWESALTEEQRLRIYEEQSVGLLAYGDSVLRRQDEVRILNETERIVETNVFPPIAYYKFEDNTDDSIGPYDGTGFTGTYTASGPPNHGKAGVFDGNDSVDIGTEIMDWDRTQPFSLAVWVKTTQGTGNFGWICKGTGIASQKGIYLFHNSTSPFINLFDVATSSEIRVKSSITTNDGNWHLVSVSYEGDSDANNIKFYVDGVLDTSPSIQLNSLSGDITNTEETRIGANSTPGAYFIGDLSEAMIFDYALSDDQHVALWESSDGQPIFSARKFMGQTRLANETENITENIVDSLTTEGLVKIVNETLQISEAILNPMALTRIIDESENVEETALAIRNLVRLVAETVSITESIVRLQGQTRIVDENVNIAEGVLNIRGLVREIAETIAILGPLLPGAFFGTNDDLTIEDFSTYATQGEADAKWAYVGGNFRVFVASDILNWLCDAVSGQSHTITKDLGKAYDNFEMRWKYQTKSRNTGSNGNNNHGYFGIFNNNTVNWGSPGSGLLIHAHSLGSTYNLHFRYGDNVNGEAMTLVFTIDTSWVTDEIHYLSVKKVGDRLTFTDYGTDSSYTTPVTQQAVDAPSFPSCRYIRGYNRNNASSTSNLTNELDDIQFLVPEEALNPMGLNRIVDESVNILENITRLLGRTRVVDETVQVQEGIVTSKTLARIIDETINIAENTLRILGLNKVVDETENITEGEIQALGQNKIVNETLDIQERRLPLPIVYLDFEDNVNDQINNNNGTWNGTSEYVTGNTNLKKAGRLVHADNDYIQLDNENNFDFDFDDPFTVSIWVKPTTGSDGFPHIVSKRSSVANGGWYLRWDESLEKIVFFLENDSGTDYQNQASDNGSVPAGVWTHIVGTFAGNNNQDGIKLYLNGVLHKQGSSLATSGNMLNNLQVTIGRPANAGSSNRLDGDVDELLIFGEELSASQVAELFHESGGSPYADVQALRGRTRVVDETENITEQIDRLRGAVRLVDETMNIEEAENFARALARITDETENIEEDIVDVISGNIIKVVNETVQISENILSVRGLVREINETENITEQTNRVLGIIEIVDETVNILEDIVQARGIVKTVDEVQQIQEGIIKVRSLVRLANETVDVQEGELAVRGLVRLANETVNILEGIIGTRGLVRILNETENIVEQAQATIPFVKIIDETINILEGAIRAIGQVRIVNESIEVLEYRIPPPIAYLPFDNNLNNKITNGPGFEMKTGSALYDAVNKKVGSHSFDFDSTSSIKASNETDFDFMDFDTPWSMSCWFRTPTPSQNQYLATKRAGPQNSVGFSWLVRGGSTQVAFEFDNGAGYEEIIIASLPALQANTWYHFVITYDGSSNRDGLMVWQNGIQARDPISSSPSSGSFQNDLDFVLGGQNATLDCDGQMDEFCVFDYELTAQQIAEMYIADDKAEKIGSGIAQFNRGRNQIKDETEQISEQANRARGVVREIAETIEIAEQVNYLRGMVRIHNEVLDIEEGIIRKSDLVRIINETVEIDELALITLGLARIIDETMNISENAEAIKGISKVIDETVNITENIVEKLVLSLIVRVVDENVNITEGTLGRIGIVKLVNEAINILENITSKRGRVGVVDETINITELIDRVIGQNKVVDETVNIQENTLTVRGLVRRIGETLQIDEAVNSARTMVRIVNEAINIEEGNIFSRGITRIVNEFVNIAELIKSHIPRVQGTTIDIKLVDNKIYDLELSPNSIIEVNLIDNEILDLEGIGEQ